MKPINGQITISRDSEGNINLEIRDSDSRVFLARGKMGPADFARAVTGLGAQLVRLDRYPGADDAQRIGLRKVVKNVICYEKHSTKEAQRLAVRGSFVSSRWNREGWLISDYGTRSQQPADRHVYSVCKWVGADEAADHGE